MTNGTIGCIVIIISTGGVNGMLPLIKLGRYLLRISVAFNATAFTGGTGRSDRTLIAFTGQ
jgi:hypothetical protein